MPSAGVGADLVWGRTGAVVGPSGLADRAITVREPQLPARRSALTPAEASASVGRVIPVRLASLRRRLIRTGPLRVTRARLSVSSQRGLARLCQGRPICRPG